MQQAKPVANQKDSKYPPTRWLSSKQAKDFLCVSKSTLDKMCHKEEIPYYKQKNGRLRYFKQHELEAYMDSMVRFGTRSESLERNPLKTA